MYPSWPSHLLSDHLGHDVSGMDIDGADSHDLLPITRCKLANQHWDKCVELGDLFFVVLLHGVVVALLQTCKSHSDVRRPPDLCAGQSHLKRESETWKPLWFSLVVYFSSLWAKTSSKCKTNLGIVPTKAHKTYGPICFLHKNPHHWREKKRNIWTDKQICFGCCSRQMWRLSFKEHYMDWAGVVLSGY